MLLQEVGSLRNQTEQKDRQPAQAEVSASVTLCIVFSGLLYSD